MAKPSSKKLTRLPKPQKFHTLIFDFDGIFTDNGVILDQEGVEHVRCHRGDGLGIKILRGWLPENHPTLKIFILSTEINPVVSARAKKLRLDCHQGIGNKTEWVTQYLKDLGLNFSGLAYLGNDLNDLGVMRRAGLSVAPSDAHPRIKKIASATLPFPGGQGFVREFVERWINLNQIKDEELEKLV